MMIHSVKISSVSGAWGLRTLNDGMIAIRNEFNEM